MKGYLVVSVNWNQHSRLKAKRVGRVHALCMQDVFLSTTNITGNGSRRRLSWQEAAIEIEGILYSPQPR